MSCVDHLLINPKKITTVFWLVKPYKITLDSYKLASKQSRHLHEITRKKIGTKTNQVTVYKVIIFNEDHENSRVVPEKTRHWFYTGWPKSNLHPLNFLMLAHISSCLQQYIQWPGYLSSVMTISNFDPGGMAWDKKVFEGLAWLDKKQNP